MNHPKKNLLFSPSAKEESYVDGKSKVVFSVLFVRKSVLLGWKSVYVTNYNKDSECNQTTIDSKQLCVIGAGRNFDDITPQIKSMVQAFCTGYNTLFLQTQIISGCSVAKSPRRTSCIRRFRFRTFCGYRTFLTPSGQQYKDDLFCHFHYL